MIAEVGDMREGQRQQDGDAVGAAETRQHADDDAEHDADHHQQRFVRLQHDGEAVEQIANIFHVRSSILRVALATRRRVKARDSSRSAPSAAAPGTSFKHQRR